MTRDVILRRDAISLGLQRYFTGKACKSGHVDERDTKSGRCIACIRQWSLARYQENRETILDGLRERRMSDERFAQACRARSSSYHAGNRTKVRERVGATRLTDEYRSRRREEYAAKRDVILAHVRAWREKNATKLAEAHRRYRTRHSGRINAKNAARAHHIRVATPPWADTDAIKSIYERAALLGLEVDHVIPLRGRTVCGFTARQTCRSLMLI